MKAKWSEPEEEGTSLLLIADKGDANSRLDRFVSEKGTLTRSAAVKLIEDNAVFVNGIVASKSYRIRESDRVEVRLSEPESMEAIPQNIPIDIVYEDDDLIVVNKPVGMVVHPAAGNANGTLVNALLYHCGDTLSGVGGVIRPGIVHRIDKDTSGLLVVAKNDRTHLSLSEQLKEHRINRIYTAIAIGNFREDTGTVNAPIGRHPVDRKKMAVIRNSEMRARDAVTHWTTCARGEADGSAFTLLRCELETGRTHQIRVHMSATGHPLLGDVLYGGGGTKFEARHRDLIHGQCLHAGELIFKHPSTGEMLHLYAPMPNEMRCVAELLFGADAILQPPALNE